MKKILGTLISGSLVEGFLVRLRSDISVSSLKAGRFVSISSSNYKFFSLVSDLKLEVTNKDILIFPPEPEDHLLKKILKKKDIYSLAYIKPLVMLDSLNRVLPVKTVPEHFDPVCDVDEDEIELIFGSEKKDKKYFNVGTPLDMDTPLCIDLSKLSERSNGIFGKTGTGKTFITRLILAGTIKNNTAVNLIFDMHSEYGLQARKEGGANFVKGLKTLFPDKVAIFSLDPDSTIKRGGMPDYTIKIPLNHVTVDDILSLQDELNLHTTALEAAYLIYSKFKRNWLLELLSRGDNAKEFAAETGAHPESIAALYRKLKRIESLDFFVQKGELSSSIDSMLECLSRGISVVVEFGNYTSTFVYLLISNIITRRIHSDYVSRTERYLGSPAKESEPKKLLITIEEAHKFLSPSLAKQTIFGIIAREMRKYYVSLLIVDQRPSGIDSDIISQVGTKIVAKLNDEKDIQNVLTGTNDSNYLRNVLSSLDNNKQALVFGHAITIPVIVQTREYDSEFYKDMLSDVHVKPVKDLINEIF